GTARSPAAAGPAQVQVVISNTQVQTVFTLTALQPQPVTLRILDGNNQSGPPGRQLPVPLTARVEDATGNPVPNVSVIWQVLTPQSVSLGISGAASDANGIVSATAVLGAVGAAQVQVRVANLPVQTSFNLQSAFTLTGITILSGIDQVTTVGSGFSQPIVVQLLAAEGPAVGIQVQLVSGSPSVIIPNGGVAVTDSNGRAIISLQGGSAPGTALVTASAGNFSISFFLTVRAAEPSLAPLSFFNAASGQQGAVSPTEVLAIYGAGLAQGLQGCATANQVLGPLPLVLSGVRVQFTSDGYSAFAPLYAICNLGPGQEYVVVETPADLPLEIGS